MEALARRIALVAACFAGLAAAACNRTEAGPEESRVAAPRPDVAGNARTSASDASGFRPEPSAGDFAITAKVKAALLADPTLDALAIHVDTRDGAVTLSGNVTSPDTKSRAREVATRVPGVRSVVDDLALAGR